MTNRWKEQLEFSNYSELKDSIYENLFQKLWDAVVQKEFKCMLEKIKN
jgi:hypothetical protein